MRPKNQRIIRAGIVGPILAFFMFAGISRLCSKDVSDVDGRQQPPTAVRSLQQLPLYFIENNGRLDDAVRFYVQGRDKRVYFTREGVTYSLRAADPDDEAAKTWSVKLDFVGARPVKPAGRLPRQGTVSFFRGARAGATGAARTFGEVVYEDLWPGIDLHFTGDRGELKYRFAVEPGAEPDQIQVAYGGTSVRVDEAGRLALATPLGEFRDDKPYVYQEVLGEKVEVPARYRLSPEGDRTLVSFALGSYDRDRQLVIDPAVVVHAGFFGGSGDDDANDIAVDSVGNIYVVGNTTSMEDSFPVKVGPGRVFRRGGACVLGLPCGDAFVAKLNPAGELVYAGYIGGNGADTGAAIAVDRAGAAYIAGSTSSTESTFPVRRGPDLTFNRGGKTLFPTDAYVAKIDPSGTSLVYAGYIGGAEADHGADIAVDSEGSAYIVGNANSPETSFPVRIGPDLTHNSFTSNNQSTDAFIAKVRPDGSGLEYAGFVGGLSGDVGNGVAVDATGNAYLTGTTFSREDSFPVRVGPDSTFNDPQGSVNGDAFVVKVDSSGRGFVYGGYIGGASTDFGGKIAVDREGSAYVYGITASDEASFPVAVGPGLSLNGGSGCPSSPFSTPCTDVFVAKIKPDGSGLVYAGYIGGANSESNAPVPFPKGGIAVDDRGNAYVTGVTLSNERTFPVTGGPGVAFHDGVCGSFPFQTPCSESFVAKVRADGSRLEYAGYIGGDGHDRAAGIAVDTAGTAYVAGSTTSSPAGFDSTSISTHGPGGGTDVFVVRIGEEGPPAVLNAASFGDGPVAPGQIISIFGPQLGPTEVVAGDTDASGRISTLVADTQLLINGTAAPLFYVSPGQINAQVPYGLEGSPEGAIEVRHRGVTTMAVRVPVAPSAPGLFTLGGGEGQVVAVYPDGSLNSSKNPAAAGQILTLYATGEGATTPGGSDGTLAAAPLPKPVLPVAATIGELPAEILYFGAAPGYAGLMQINLRIPEDLPPGAATPVRLQVGSALSQAGATLATR